MLLLLLLLQLLLPLELQRQHLAGQLQRGVLPQGRLWLWGRERGRGCPYPRRMLVLLRPVHHGRRRASYTGAATAQHGGADAQARGLLAAGAGAGPVEVRREVGVAAGGPKRVGRRGERGGGRAAVRRLHGRRRAPLLRLQLRRGPAQTRSAQRGSQHLLPFHLYIKFKGYI